MISAFRFNVAVTYCTVYKDHSQKHKKSVCCLPSSLWSFGCTLRLRFALVLSFGPLGDDICLSSSLFAGGKFSCSMLSNLNLLQSLITPLGPVDMTNSILYSVIGRQTQFNPSAAGCGFIEHYSQNVQGKSYHIWNVRPNYYFSPL